MSTIQDVARRAGVSNSTVSNVLNGRTNRMRADTLARIEAAIQELGFQPNRAARLLKTGHTPLIGLLVPSIANPSYAALGQEVETAARRQGHRVLMGNTHRSPENEMEFFADLLSHGARGVIVFSSLLDDSYFQQYVERGLVVVSFDSRPGHDRTPLVDYVSMDNFAAGRLAVDHLRGFGHSRLAFLSASGQTTSRREKIAGFLAAAQEAGIADSVQVLSGRTCSEYGDAEMAEVGRALAGEVLESAVPPTGVVTINDMLAIGFIAGLAERGLKVPDDISVVGMDNILLATLVSPPLTSIGGPLTDMADTMIDRVVRRLADSGIAPAEFLFAPALVPRGSVGPPRPAR